MLYRMLYYLIVACCRAALSVLRCVVMWFRALPLFDCSGLRVALPSGSLCLLTLRQSVISLHRHGSVRQSPPQLV